MPNCAWKSRILRVLEVVLPAHVFWVMQNAMQIRRGYLHETDFRLFHHLADLEFLVADIGAHRGQSAISILSTTSRARVVSFEPNPNTRLALSCVKRRFGPRFDWQPLAVSDQSGQTLLHIPRSGRFEHSPSASLEPAEFDKDYVRERFRDESGGIPYTHHKSRPVSVVRLNETGLRPDVIKVDVEGSEAAVLRGARQILERDAPLLMIELNNLEEFHPLLETLGYRLYRYDGDRDQLVRFEPDSRPLNLFALSDRSRADFRQRLLPDS